MFLLAALLFACSSDDSPEPEITIATANEYSIASGVNSRVEVSFTSTYAWQAKVDCDWLVISPTKGEAGNASINVLATEENRTGDVRTATLTITSEEITKNLTIKQEAIDVINLKSNTYTIGEKGGDYDIEYATNLNKWIFDFTASVNGPSRVYSFMANAPQIKQGKDGFYYSPVFPLLYLQVTKRFKGVDIYVGGENLTGFTQKQAILGGLRNDGSFNPSSSSFDASCVWGPLMGAKFYAGMRLTLWKK